MSNGRGYGYFIYTCTELRRKITKYSWKKGQVLLAGDSALWVFQERPEFLEQFREKELYTLKDWRRSDFDFAAEQGHLEIVKFFHRNGIRGATEDAMDYASKRGHLELVKFLHFNREEGCTVLAMEFAADNGHFDVVKFLHENRTEGCTYRAIDLACVDGHLDVVRFLMENRNEGCSSKALIRSAFFGHFNLVKYLCEKGRFLYLRLKHFKDALEKSKAYPEIQNYLLDFCQKNENAIYQLNDDTLQYNNEDNYHDDVDDNSDHEDDGMDSSYFNGEGGDDYYYDDHSEINTDSEIYLDNDNNEIINDNESYTTKGRAKTTAPDDDFYSFIGPYKREVEGFEDVTSPGSPTDQSLKTVDCEKDEFGSKPLDGFELSITPFKFQKNFDFSNDASVEFGLCDWETDKQRKDK